jgi:hypothetical protein
MESVLIRIFYGHFKAIRNQKPRVAWLLRSPTGPLLIWGCFWLLSFEKQWGRGMPWFAKGMGCVYLGLAGLCFSAYSIAELAAWGCYLHSGPELDPEVNPPDTNPDDTSESN